MRIRLTAIGLLVGAALAVPWPGGADNFGTLRFEQYLEALRDQAGIPGLSAAIVQDRSIVWERGFGEADVDRKIPATPDTPYPIGALTTTLTAVQALRCAEQGLISLDAPAVSFASRFPDPQVSLRQVLQHVQTGDRFVYDPARYSAVAAAAEVCFERSFRESTVDMLIDGMAMTDSVPGHDLASWSPSTRGLFSPGSLDRFAGAMSRLATLYRSNGRSKPVATALDATVGLTGGGGVIASARDLGRFQAALDAGLLLEPDSIANAWQSPRLTEARHSPHGLGWFSQVYESRLTVWQFGVIPDTSSALLITIPQRGVTLILLANSDGLVAPFPLADGDISPSPFARLFLRLF